MLCTWLVLLRLPGAARASKLRVRPTRVLKLPAQAATGAADSDVIRIDPGPMRIARSGPRPDWRSEAAGPVVREDNTITGDVEPVLQQVAPMQ
jgi:hypothetical protein